MPATTFPRLILGVACATAPLGCYVGISSADQPAGEGDPDMEGTEDDEDDDQAGGAPR